MERVLTGVFRGGIGLMGGSFIINNCMFSVDGGQRGLIFDKMRGGYQDTLAYEGTSFVIPFFQQPIIIDIRTTPREIKSVTGTKDLQMVNIYLRVLSRPVEKHLAQLHRDFRGNHNERVFNSIGNEVLKSVVAQYNAEELLSKREEVSQKIRVELAKRAAVFNLVLDDVSITHLVFGKEFTTAIESKQVAEQQAERETFIVQRSEQEKRARIIRAEGESEAATLISEAMKRHGDGYLEVRRIDASKDVAGMLAKSRSVTYLPGGGGQNLLLGLNDR